LGSKRENPTARHEKKGGDRKDLAGVETQKTRRLSTKGLRMYLKGLPDLRSWMKIDWEGRLAMRGSFSIAGSL